VARPLNPLISGSRGDPARPVKLRVGAIVCLVSAVAGCTVGPDFQPPAVPAVVSFLPPTSPHRPTSGDAVSGQLLVRGVEIPHRWWVSFGSSALNALIEDGLRHNADLEAAEAAIRMAQANALAQRSSLFPVVGASFDSSRQGTPTRTLTSNAASGANIYSLHTAQLTVSFVPDVFGGARRQIESSQALTEVQAFQRDGLALTLASNIAVAAIQEGSLRAQIGAVQRLIGIQNQLLAVLRRQHAAGQIAMQDVVSQETALAQSRLLLPPLEKQLGQQRNLLAFLTGRLPAEGVRPTFHLTSFRLPRKIPIGLPGDLVRRRPDVRAAEANLHALNAQIGVAIANRLPQITLSGNAGSSADALSRLFSPGTGIWMLAGSVAQSIFDAGAREYRQRAAEAATAQAAAQYRSTVLAAFQNVADVLRTLQADSKTVAAAAVAEVSADKNIGLVRKQLDEGQISVPALISAQQAYLQIALTRVQAQAAQLADTVALYQALGGDWTERPPALPAPVRLAHEETAISPDPHYAQ
jgi:NodT family efflux transporter outer membrane factor (OMF) lipoprotein